MNRNLKKRHDNHSSFFRNEAVLRAVSTTLQSLSLHSPVREETCDSAHREFRADISAEAGRWKRLGQDCPIAVKPADAPCRNHVKAKQQEDGQAKPATPMHNSIGPDGAEERCKERVNEPGNNPITKLSEDVCNAAAQYHQHIGVLRKFFYNNGIRVRPGHK